MRELIYPVVKQNEATVDASQHEYRVQARVDHSNSECNKSGHPAVERNGGASCPTGQTGKMAEQTNR